MFLLIHTQICVLVRFNFIFLSVVVSLKNKLAAH